MSNSEFLQRKSTQHWSRRRFLVGIAAGSGIVGSQLGCSTRSRTGRAGVSDPAELDLIDASRAIRTRSLSPEDLTRACLERIARLDRRLNSFITVTPERALAHASEAEDEVAKGHWRGPIHGIPIALKDNIDTAGVRTTAASGVFADLVPTKDAEVVQLLRAAGAIIVGKLNMHEFALGTTSAISHFGPVHNPWDIERIAGGSSGGTAAAVAASLCFGAVGTDTGGSNRIPAACCGIVGLKPTYGVVSTDGIVPVSRSFDHVGPMCRTVTDTALMFRAMTKHPVAEACDPDALPPISNLRVGVFKTPGSLCDDIPIQEEVEAAVQEAINVIRPLVAEIREAKLPAPNDLGRLIDAEAYQFHAPHLAKTPELYNPRTREIILAGRQISELEAARLRKGIDHHRGVVHEAFSQVDLVILPTIPGLPMLIREATKPFSLAGCTFAFSLGGLPSMSIPCGFSRSHLPIGLLIGGPSMSEPRILALAQAYERVTDWHLRRPPL